ncbi:hypothetical protein PQR62_14485 [Herbaspirillum lusitanum]|jgi:type IV secretory pathway VirB10-like protein|uniref:Uncharacterized protein n=1 Tax=Herbaspirillum lusitanum TaxID=213312 RepID=A0ABW9ACI4_9BURK
MSSTSFQVRTLNTLSKLALILGVSLSLSACDYISSFSKPKQTPEEARAEGIALGAGCRQAGQTLEDCYQRNPDALKAGIFAGWKDMHEYMAAKNIQTVTPPPPPVKEAEAPKEASKDGAKDEKSSRSRDRESSRSRDRDRDSSASKDGKDSKDSKESKDSSSDRSSRASRDTAKNY